MATEYYKAHEKELQKWYKIYSSSTEKQLLYRAQHIKELMDWESTHFDG